MKVYKFGGASVRNADGVRNLLKIIGDERDLFVIVSAMGKTTNALERVFAGVQQADRQAVAAEIAALREYHATIIEELWHGPVRLERVEAFFAELEEVTSRADGPWTPSSATRTPRSIWPLRRRACGPRSRGVRNGYSWGRAS